jgi:uridine kinase
MDRKRPYVISVNAVSGGGKTALSEALRDSLSAELFCFDDFDDTNVHPDDLYEWCKRGADLLEYDCPGMWEAVARRLREGSVKYVVLDYPFGRDHPRFRAVIDLSVFIDTPLDIAMARRILRDLPSDPAAADEKLRHLRNEMEQYILKARHPYLETYRHRDTADLILDGRGTVREWKEQVLARIQNPLPPR